MKNSYALFFLMLLVFALPLLLVGIMHYSRNIITPNDQFFELQKGEIPEIEKENWTLEVEGEIKNKLIFDYNNFTNLDSSKEIATLECVEGPYGTAEWEGVPLREILELADLNDDAYDVVFYAADNYSDSLQLEEASADNILLAYRMNGESLPKEQGFPLKLVCPDHYGYKWVKWIVRIEIVDYDYIGFWEERGWSDEAMRTGFSSWITHAYLFSIAFIFGGISMISGYKFAPKENLFKHLPKFVSKRFHIITSLIFGILSSISFLYWIISTALTRGTIFYSLHGIVSLFSIIMIILSSIIGSPRLTRIRRRNEFHFKLGKIAFSLFLGSILFGLLIATVGGFRLNQIFGL